MGGLEFYRQKGWIHQINVSEGGVPKIPVGQASVTALGLEGDGHYDLRHHGGLERALCLFTLEQIGRLRAEGHSINPGTTGENITLLGIDLALLIPGIVLTLGERVQVEITAYATPCKTIRDSFLDGDFTRISPKNHPGESRVYARVLQGGMIRVGQQVYVT